MHRLPVIDGWKVAPAAANTSLAALVGIGQDVWPGDYQASIAPLRSEHPYAPPAMRTFLPFGHLSALGNGRDALN